MKPTATLGQRLRRVIEKLPYGYSIKPALAVVKPDGTREARWQVKQNGAKIVNSMTLEELLKRFRE